jgi:hypothetical protein
VAEIHDEGQEMKYLGLGLDEYDIRILAGHVQQDTEAQLRHDSYACLFNMSCHHANFKDHLTKIHRHRAKASLAVAML